MTITYYRTVNDRDILINRVNWTEEETNAVLSYLSQGLSEKQIAQKLNRTLLSVRGRIGTLRQQYKVPNNTALVAMSIREGRI